MCVLMVSGNSPQRSRDPQVENHCPTGCYQQSFWDREGSYGKVCGSWLEFWITDHQARWILFETEIKMSWVGGWVGDLEQHSSVPSRSLKEWVKANKQGSLPGPTSGLPCSPEPSLGLAQTQLVWVLWGPKGSLFLRIIYLKITLTIIQPNS